MDFPTRQTLPPRKLSSNAHTMRFLFLLFPRFSLQILVMHLNEIMRISVTCTKILNQDIK